MTMNDSVYEGGAGFSAGSPLLVDGPLYMSGTIYYLDSVNGSDSANGLSFQTAKQTLSAGLTAASSGDMVALAADFDETLTAALNIAAGVILVGAGTSAGLPTAIIRINASSDHALIMNGDRAEIHNIKFPVNVQANTQGKVSVGVLAGNSSAESLVKGCLFEVGANDGSQISVEDADGTHIEDCTFNVTGTTVGTGSIGIDVRDVGIVGAVFRNLSFDGFSVGFGNAEAIDASGSSLGRCRFENITVKNGSNILIDPVGTGRINVNGVGSSRVIFA